MDGSESGTGNNVQKTPSILYTSAKWKNATCVFCGSSSGNDEEFSVREAWPMHTKILMSFDVFLLAMSLESSYSAWAGSRRD